MKNQIYALHRDPFLFKPCFPIHNRTLHALSNDGSGAKSSLTSLEYAFPSVRGQESRSLPCWLLSVASRQEKAQKRSRKTPLSPFLFPWKNTPTNPHLLFWFLIVFLRRVFTTRWVWDIFSHKIFFYRKSFRSKIIKMNFVCRKQKTNPKIIKNFQRLQQFYTRTLQPFMVERKAGRKKEICRSTWS